MATNRRQQIQLSPDEQAAFFRERKKAALATIDKDGFPHVVAMNYFARAGAFYMTSYGKAQKVVNIRSEEHTSELQSPYDLVCRLLLEKKKKKTKTADSQINNRTRASSISCRRCDPSTKSS